MMMRVFFLIVIVVSLLSAPIHAQDSHAQDSKDSFNYYYLRSAKDVYALCTGEVTFQIQCLGVLQGAYEESEYLQQLMHGKYNVPLLYCIPPEINSDGESIKRMLSKYVELAHPDLNQGFAQFFIIMMRQVFPCNSAKSSK